jgi:pyruvate-formate lyase-activating enzyme
MTRKSTLQQTSGFSYRFGNRTKTGYGASQSEERNAPGGSLHLDTVRLVAMQNPRGFLRMTRRLSRRFVYKGLHFAFGPNSPSRVLNFLLYLRERRRKSSVRYMPPLVFVDPTSKCTLRCPGCATGLGLTRKRTTAPLHMMKTVVDQVSRTAAQIAFYHLGEPFLNDEVFDALKYARSKGLWTLVDTHLSLDRPRLAERIVESGLHELVVSCDGASQSTYEQYRKGGDVELVLANIQAVRNHRDRLRRRTPFIRAKMILFEHNWHEARLFQSRARAHGADEVHFFLGNGPDMFADHITGSGSQFDVAELAWKAKVPSGPCEQIWQDMFVTPDGGIFSCCLGYRDEDLFVPPGTDLDIRTLWNSESYVAARKFFLREHDERQLPGPCRSCGYVTNFSRRS